MAWRVIQWGTGSVGSLALGELLRSPDFEVVGVKVYGDDKLGVDAGTLAGGAPGGVRAVREIDELPLAGADCVLYCPMVADYDDRFERRAAGLYHNTAVMYSPSISKS